MKIIHFSLFSFHFFSYLCILKNTINYLMGERIKKLKKIRIHREGTNELTLSMLAIALIGTGLWYALDSTIPFWIFVVIFGAAWLMALNF